MTSAVFIGDGELSLTPPLENEKKALAIYAKGATLVEPFTEMVLRFSDKTFDEVKGSANAKLGARPSVESKGSLFDPSNGSGTEEPRSSIHACSN